MVGTLIFAVIGILGSGAVEILPSVGADFYAYASVSRKMRREPSLLPSPLTIRVSGDDLMQAGEASGPESVA